MKKQGPRSFELGECACKIDASRMSAVLGQSSGADTTQNDFSAVYLNGKLTISVVSSGSSSLSDEYGPLSAGNALVIRTSGGRHQASGAKDSISAHTTFIA